MRRAALLSLALLCGLGCRRRPRAARRGPPPPVIVSRIAEGTTVVDADLTTRARAIDALLGGVCPRTIRLPNDASEEDARTLAEACVGAGAHLTGDAAWRASAPWGRGLVALAIVRSNPDDALRDADAISLRTIGRSALAGGLTVDDAIVHAADATTDETTSDATAFALVETLADRPDVGVLTVVRLARESARGRRDEALEEPPIHTDVDTFFSVARAEILSFHPPRAPRLGDVELVAAEPGGAGALLVRFDRALREGFVTLGEPRPIEAFVCGVRTEPTFDAPDLLRFPADPARCEEVDGARIVELEIARTPAEAPRGLSGALVRKAYARVIVGP